MDSYVASPREEVLVFGAQGLDYSQELHSLLARASKDESDNGQVCRAFLHAAHSAILDEASSLSPQLCAHFPALADIKSLAELARYFTAQTTTRNAAIDGAVLTLFQVASTLLAGPSLLLRLQNVTGLCSGSLAAAAVAFCDSSPLQLANCGVELIRLAFWIGVEAGEEARKWPSGSWALVCFGRHTSEERVQDKLNTFNQRLQQQPTFSPLYISTVIANSNVTVSGPPVHLDLFQKTCLSSLRDSSQDETTNDRIECVRIGITSPYHSRDLLETATKRVLAKVEERNIAPQLRNQAARDINLLLPFAVLEEEEEEDLVATLVQGVLTRVNRWDAVVKQLEHSPSQKIHFSDDKSARGLAAQLGSSDTLQSLSSAHSSTLQESKSDFERDQIAIVSVSCRFPEGADTPEKFWAKLEAQANCCREIPAHLFDWRIYRHGQKNGLTVPPHGNFLENVDLFDNQLFSMSPKESHQLDPQHRFALMCCYEAMEDAGYVPEQMASYRTTRVGCFIGASSDDYRENASGEIGAYFITGNIRAFIPGHVSFAWNLEAPSNSVDTACSSSLVAIESACDALLNKQCDAALAGGVNILTQPQMFIGLQRAGLLSPTGQSRTFDENVDGICRGDGVGIVMLKRLSTAQAEGDNVLGVIRGCRSNFASLDCHTRLASPDQLQLERLFEETCREAQVDPLQVTYIDAHGAGNKNSEAVEVNAIANVFGSDHKRSHPLYIGSPKPTFGYSEAACGMAALVKVLKLFEKRRLPGLRRNSPDFRLNDAFGQLQRRQVQIPMDTVDLSEHKHLLAGISNTNFLGGNSFMLLQEATPTHQGQEQDPRTHFIVTISAKTRQAAEATRAAYASTTSLFDDHTSLSNASYTSTARRQQFAYRVAVTGHDGASIVAALKLATPVQSINDTKPAFLSLAMGQLLDEEMSKSILGLIDTSRTFRLAFEEAFTAAAIPSNSKEWAQGFALQVAYARLWIKWLPLGVIATDSASLASTLAIVGALDVATAAHLAADESLSLNIRFAPVQMTTIVCGRRSTICISAGQVINAQTLFDLLSAAQGASPSTSKAIVEYARARDIAPSRCFVLMPVQDCGDILADCHLLPLNINTWKGITETLAALYKAGIDPDWKAYHADYAAQVHLTKLPNYQFDLQSYWMAYEDRGLLPSQEEPAANTARDNTTLQQFGVTTPFALLGQQQHSSGDQVSTTFRIDVASNPLLMSAARGHRKHGKASLPAAVFCEQAMEVATYLLNKEGNNKYTLHTTQLQLLQPYILNETDEQPPLYLHVQRLDKLTIECTWSALGQQLATCQTSLVVVADCPGVVPASLARALANQRRQVQSRGNILSEALAYRLLSKATEYSHRSMRQPCLRKDEAVASIASPSKTQSSGLVVHLSTLEGLLQVTDLITNVGLLDNSETDTFSLEGIGTLSVSADHFGVDGERALSVYAVAKGDIKKSATVDCYIFDDDDNSIIATMLGVRYIKGRPSSAEIKSSPAAALRTTPPKPTPTQRQVVVAQQQQEVSVAQVISDGTASIMAKLRQVLLDELGIAEKDLVPETVLADLGLDSLMSLQVLGAMREKCSLELPSSLFMDFPTLGKVEAYLQGQDRPGEKTSLQTPPASPDSRSMKDVKAIVAEVGTTRPILIAGRSHVGKNCAPIFMLPDGSGSGAVYAEMVDLGRPVYAVTSPFLSRDQHTSWSVEDIAAKYVACIATIHPQGQPLLLGGWSFGGIVAFEICRLLQTQKETFALEGVLLIDCPDPSWPPLPDTVLDWLFGPNGHPELRTQRKPTVSPSMRAHFASTLAALARYRPAPLEATNSANPSFVIVNGLDGLGGKAEDVKGWNVAVGWLQDDRRELGMHGWLQYLPRESANLVEVPGNHFTICQRRGFEAMAVALQDLWAC